MEASSCTQSRPGSGVPSSAPPCAGAAVRNASTLARGLHRAVLRLRRSGDAIAVIPLEAGFNELSTFNHRFRGVT